MAGLVELGEPVLLDFKRLPFQAMKPLIWPSGDHFFGVIMKNFLIFLGVAAVLCTLSSCVSVTKQSKQNMILDASQESEIEGTGMNSADIRSMADEMARDISAISWPKEMTKVRIALTEIDNQTRFPINPNIIKDRLLANLVEFALKDMHATTKLQFTENPAFGDYYLSARITALSKGSSAGVNDYLLYSFKLMDKADTVVWMRAYETKKQGQTGVMYR
jgi:hypothetical protein